jgi:tetratricopeptide (TPR) repeat protein
VSRPRLISLLIALLTLVVYLPVWRCDFISFDDGDYVYENPNVQRGLTVAGVKWAFTCVHSSNWHPITWMSHMLDCELFGLNPGAHHWINALFHALNAVLLFRLLLRMTRAQWPSAFIAAVFAWHPLHVESVAWVSERKDVLSTLFGLLAIGAYVRFVRPERCDPLIPGKRPPLSKSSWPTSKFYWLSLLFFALGLMSKPMLVTLPFVLLLLDYWPLNRLERPLSAAALIRLTSEKSPFLLLTLLSSVITYLAQRTDAVVSLDRLPFGMRLENALVSYVSYIGKTFWPVDLAVIYPLTSTPSALALIGSVALLVLVTIGVWLLRCRARYLVTGWFWFLGMLVPVIGLVQVGGQALADRYMYLPMVGLLLIVAFGAKDLLEHFKLPAKALFLPAGLACAGCIALTVHQLSFWRDSETLFGHALAVTKRNVIAELNFGVALERAGRKDEAAQHYFKALDLDPDRFQAHNNVANVLADLGRREEAQVHYLESLRLKTNAPPAHLNYGTLLVDMGKFDKALEQYREAARLAPADPRPHYLSGKASLRQNRVAEAIAHFRDALQLDPDDFQSLTYLARILAASDQPELRNGSESLRLAEKANELTGGQQSLVLDALAMAYAECGRYSEAQQVSRVAIELARPAGRLELIALLEKHAITFGKNQPVRESAVELLSSSGR